MNQTLKFFNLPLFGTFALLIVRVTANYNVENDIINFYSTKQIMLEVIVAYLAPGDIEHMFCKNITTLKNHGAGIEFIHFLTRPSLKFPAIACMNEETKNYDAFITLAEVDDEFKYVRLQVVDQNLLIAGDAVRKYKYRGSTDLQSLTKRYLENPSVNQSSKGVMYGRLEILNEACKSFQGISFANFETIKQKDILVGKYILRDVWTLQCSAGFRLALASSDFRIFMKLDMRNRFEDIMRVLEPVAGSSAGYIRECEDSD